jgi:hypothetical protein
MYPEMLQNDQKNKKQDKKKMPQPSLVSHPNTSVPVKVKL